MSSPELPINLEQSLDSILAWVETTDAAQFLTREAPLYVTEYITYERWSATAGSATALFFVLVMCPLLTYAACLSNKKYDGPYSSDFWAVAIAVSGVGAAFAGLGGVIGFLTTLDHTLKVWFAPRVVILEHLSNLL